jgi:hypothetical protein
MTTTNKNNGTTQTPADKAKQAQLDAAATQAANDAAAKAQAEHAAKVAAHNARFERWYNEAEYAASYAREDAARYADSDKDKAAKYAARAVEHTKAMHQTALDWYKASQTDDACGKPTEDQIIAAVKAQALDTKAATAIADKAIKSELAAAKKEAADRAASLTLAEITTTARAKSETEIVKDASKVLNKYHDQAQTALATGEFGARHSLKAAVVEMKQGTAILAGTAAVIGGDLRSLTGKNAAAILSNLYAPTTKNAAIPTK